MITNQERYYRYLARENIVSETFTTQLLAMDKYKKNPQRVYGWFLNEVMAKATRRLRTDYSVYKKVNHKTRYKSKPMKVLVGEKVIHEMF
jgi:hypothetical protein